MTLSVSAVNQQNIDRPGRTSVLWVDPPPSTTFRGECEDRQWEFHCISVDDFIAHAPGARAVILHVNPDDTDFRQRAQRIIDEAMMFGVTIVLLMRTRSTQFEPPTEEEMTEFSRGLKMLRHDSTRVIRCMQNHWHELAVNLASTGNEPAANDDLKFDGHTPDELESRVLLKRAFSDAEVLYIRPLTVGKSGAEVLRIAKTAKDASLRSTELVAKIYESEDLREESGYKLIESAVPHRLFAPVAKPRSRRGLKRSVVVYSFLHRAAPLVEMMGSGLPDLIESLFAHTLGTLHHVVAEQSDNLVARLMPRVIRESRELDEVSKAAAQTGALDWTSLRELIGAIRPIAYSLCTTHGDLHIGNLFVPEQTCDVVIIDYATVTPSSPFVVDPACLEVSLVFPPTFMLPAGWSNFPDPDWLRRAFQYPFTITNLGGPGAESSLVGAIEVIRRRMKKSGEDRAVYGMGVAAFLLRFASFEDNGTRERRVIAYEIAATILEAVRRELDQRHAKTKRGA
ncbi:MAG TPA: hypothetical protein VGM82_03090 [Gemmatimonadaceae bacterium]